MKRLSENKTLVALLALSIASASALLAGDDCKKCSGADKNAPCTCKCHSCDKDKSDKASCPKDDKAGKDCEKKECEKKK